MSRRIVPVFYDVTGSRHLNGDGNPISDLDIPWVYVNERVTINLTTVKGVIGTVIPFRTDLSWSAVLNDAYGANTMAARASNDAVNLAGDWGDNATANPLTGQMSIRFDCNSDKMSTMVGSSASTAIKLEIQGHDSNGLLSYVLYLRINLRNLMDRGQDVNPTTTPWAIGRDEANAKFAAKVLPDLFMVHPTYGPLWCFPDGTWRALRAAMTPEGHFRAR